VGAGDETTANLPIVVQELSASEATRVELPDGAVWDKATGKLTAYPFSNATADQNALVEAGFTVSSVETVTNYPDVTITVDDNGVVTITSRRAGAAKELLTASDDEATAVKALLSATTSTKLVFAGPFNADDLAAVSSNDNDAVTSVNMSEATFENYSDMKFTYWSSTLQKATTSVSVPGNFVITQSAFSGCTQIREVVFNSGIIGEKVIANNGGDIPYFNKVTIGSGITEIQNQAFNKYPITDLDWSNATSLEVIGKEAFEDCPFTNVSTLTIPSSVKTIKEKAFFNICKPLTQAEVNAGKGVKTIIFPADTHLDEGEGIEDHAFWLESTDANPLKDVYVNANREIPCHKEAFSHWNTDGQTQVTQTGARTRLHYPTAFFDFYVGDYKSDINGGFLVGNPEMIKSRDSQYRINGWQKFISSGILMAPDVTWRSFSDDVPYYVPDVNKKGWRTEVYLVDGYDSSKGAKLVRMKIGDLIPANTGVIVHFEFNSTDGAVLYLPAALKEVTVDGETMKIIDPEKAAVNPYDVEVYSDHLYTPKGKTDSYKNYLKKLNKEPVYIDNVEIENGKKTYRNFFFCNNDDLKETDNEKWRGTEWSEACLQGWGFLRAVHGTYTVSNKAYLHFPATEGFPGAESVGIQEDHGTDTNAAALAKQFGFTTFNEDGEEFNCMPEDLGITTDIKQVENVGHNNIFYNLQGLKVENPSKGIYIRNGKKYVIK
jgi:hypothetical protein